MAAPAVLDEGVVEEPGKDLESDVHTAGAPLHLLLLFGRLLMTRLSADSTNEVEMVSPARWRSPSLGMPAEASAAR